MQQACFSMVGRLLRWPACLFLHFPAWPFSVLVGEADSPPFCILSWLVWSASAPVVVLEGVTNF